MTDQLGSTERRLEGVNQFSAVISAIRGMAAVRLNEAERRLDGITAFAATIAQAIGEAIALLPQAVPAPGQPSADQAHLLIALCSEHGFVGGFNAHVLDTVERLLAEQPGPFELFFVGSRGATEAKERGLETSGTLPTASHAEEVMTLANRMAEELYRRLDAPGIGQVTLVHAIPGQRGADCARKLLIPFDYGRFPKATPGEPPLINLAPADLLEALALEYVFAEISEAIMLSYAAENEARMYAMLSASANITRKQAELTALVRRLRQEKITAEVIELAVGTLAGEADLS